MTTYPAWWLPYYCTGQQRACN